jgi:hypothetical protein
LFQLAAIANLHTGNADNEGVDKQELKTFITETMNNRAAPHKWVRIGELVKEMRTYIAKDGYLLVFDAWRQKKAQRNTTANMPSVNALDDSLSAYAHYRPKPTKKSSGFFLE